MVTTVVGALPHEREIAQPLRVDLSLVVDLHDAGRSDELGDTVHYGEVTDRVAAVVRENKDVLLERLADRIAEVVVGFDRVEAVELTVTKLRPPIAEHVETTSVSIRRTRTDYDVAPRSSHRAIVALGSNLGDRESYLSRALDGLGDIVATSQVFETDPIGGPDAQGPYLNMVAAVETTLDPFAFVRRCQRIEADALRQRTVRWGPRTLDVDVLFYDDVDHRLAGADDPAPADRRAPLRPRPARRGGAGAMPAGMGRHPPAGGRAPARPAALAVGGSPLELADLGGVVRTAVLGLLADDDVQQLVVLHGLLPRQGDVQRQIEAAQRIEVGVDPLLVPVAVLPRPLRRGEPGARVDDAAVAQAVPVGVGEAGVEELDDHLDRISLHMHHLAWVRTGQERHDDGHVEVGGDAPTSRRTACRRRR